MTSPKTLHDFLSSGGSLTPAQSKTFMDILIQSQKERQAWWNSLTRRQKAAYLKERQEQYQQGFDCMVATYRPKPVYHLSYGIFSNNGNPPFLILRCQWDVNLIYPGRFFPKGYYSKKPVPWGGWVPTDPYLTLVNTHHRRYLSDQLKYHPRPPFSFNTLKEAIDRLKPYTRSDVIRPELLFGNHCSWRKNVSNQD